MLQATLPEIKLALSSKSRDLLSHVISECMQMRGRIYKFTALVFPLRTFVAYKVYNLPTGSYIYIYIIIFIYADEP